MPILGSDPKEREQQAPLGRQIQGGPTLNQGPGPMSTIVNAAAPKIAEAAFTSGTNAMASQGAGLMNTVGNALGGTAAAGSAGAKAAAAAAAKAAAAKAAAAGTTGALATGATTAATGAAAGGGLAAMAPMLAAAGPFALLALPFLLNNGTSKVPEVDYGPDPLAQGYNNGTNMAYAGGTDSVPAMLTPGEAVIPAAAAQNPNNKPMINAMVNEGREANAIATGEPMPQPEMNTPAMAGPLSGKSQREQMKLMQDMSFKKKAFEAEEMRKQMAFEQKMSQGNMKAMLAMRQSQE